MFQSGTLTDQAIRDTVRAVFSAARYDDRRSLGQRLWEWTLQHVISPVFYWLGRMFSAAWGRTEFRWALLVGLVVLVALSIWRFVVAAYDDPRRARLAMSGGDVRRHGGDPLATAQRLAAAGDFTGAAHALYAALLLAAARRERLELHPSKTVGDYARDLRGRSSDLFARFRDFARSYEFVIYGLGECDRERYERLWTLASPIVTSHG